MKYGLIMAAGKGERMRPLTDYIPKALVEYKGKPLIYYVIDEMKKYVENIYITVGHKKNLLIQNLLKREFIDVAGFIDTTAMGNCWWIYDSIMRFVNESVLVSACDIIWRDTLDIFDNRYACTVISSEIKVGVDGDFITEYDGIISSLSRTKPNSKYCSGIQILNPHLINWITTNPVNNFYTLWEQLIERKQLYCSCQILKDWKGFDTMEQLNER